MCKHGVGKLHMLWIFVFVLSLVTVTCVVGDGGALLTKFFVQQIL